MILEMYRIQMRYEDFSNIILVLSLLHELLVYNFYELLISSALALGILDVSTKILSKFTVEFISGALFRNIDLFFTWNMNSLDRKSRFGWYYCSRMTQKTNASFSLLFCPCVAFVFMVTIGLLFLQVSYSCSRQKEGEGKILRSASQLNNKF